VDPSSPELVAVSQDLLGHKLYKYPFKALTAEGLTVSNPDILVYDEEPKPACNEHVHFADPDPSQMHSTEQTRLAKNFGCEDAVLGLSVLSKLHMYISEQEKMIYITDAKAN